MALNRAHEGYEYQDLLVSSFILQEILDENDAHFVIDRKQYKEDRIDDLVISNVNGTFKKQIKYSNFDSNHTLTKNDLSSDSPYNLSIDALFEAWEKNTNSPKPQFKLCLAWNSPDESLDEILYQVKEQYSFENYSTKVYKINIDKLWPVGQLPIASWQRFKTVVANGKIQRDIFSEFCNDFLIELEFPKFSLDLKAPGDLERIVLDQIKKLGIGIYPNHHYTIEGFAAALILLVKRARSKGVTITTDTIFREFDIKKDYGSIEQVFPINPNPAFILIPETFLNVVSEMHK